MYKFLLTIGLIGCNFSLLANEDKIFSIEQQSDKAIYNSNLVCDKELHTGSFQSCHLKLTHAGKSVENTELFISGGMPQHQHGLPTSPKVTWSKEKKYYVIHGLKFSMSGKWKLNFNVNAAADSAKDTIVISIKVY